MWGVCGVCGRMIHKASARNQWMEYSWSYSLYLSVYVSQTGVPTRLKVHLCFHNGSVS